jgi:hypothetical protein
MAINKPKTPGKQIHDSNAAVVFDLTAESLLKAATIPNPPTSKQPAIVRTTHNSP